MMTIDQAANLKVTLGGDFVINDSWVLMRYTTLSGQFEEGVSFTNEQGYTFDVNYGSGSNDTVTLTLTSDSERPKIDSLVATPAAISAGAAYGVISLTVDAHWLQTVALRLTM